MITCWSVKGGSGTTVITALLAAEASRVSPVGTTLVDLAGDLPTVFATSVDVEKPGLRQWLAASTNVPANGLQRLLVNVMPGLELLPQGPTATTARNPLRQAARLADFFDAQPLFVDAGVVSETSPLADVMRAQSSYSIVVLRSCFLGVKRFGDSGLSADGFVLVEEPGRSFGCKDIEDAIGVEHLATLRWDPAVARAVDAGRTKSRPPRSAKSLTQLARRLVAVNGLEHAV